VARSRGEAVVALEPAHHRVERVRREVDDEPAGVAHGVVVGVVDQVVGGRRASADAGADHQAGGLEHVEGPVDGGQVDLGVGALDLGRDLLGGDVVVAGGEERLQDEPW
jgi:hypothetical protein